MTLKSNSEEAALIAQEIGAEVIRGAVRYPGRERGWQSQDGSIAAVQGRAKMADWIKRHPGCVPGIVAVLVMLCIGAYLAYFCGLPLLCDLSGDVCYMTPDAYSLCPFAWWLAK